MKCECKDPNCTCKGICAMPAETTLYRIDMADETGSQMCDGCAEDAINSGVFRSEDAKPEVWCSEDGSMGVNWHEPEPEVKITVSEGFADTLALLQQRQKDEEDR